MVVAQTQVDDASMHMLHPGSHPGSVTCWHADPVTIMSCAEASCSWEGGCDLHHGVVPATQASSTNEHATDEVFSKQCPYSMAHQSYPQVMSPRTYSVDYSASAFDRLYPFLRACPLPTGIMPAGDNSLDVISEAELAALSSTLQ